MTLKDKRIEIYDEKIAIYGEDMIKWADVIEAKKELKKRIIKCFPEHSVTIGFMINEVFGE